MIGLGAWQIAQDVKTGRITAEAVISATLRDIAVKDAALNAFTAIWTDEALSEARRIDSLIAERRPVGPLAGVPFAVKNLYDVAGVVTLAGSKIRRDSPPAEADAALVERMKRAGAILVGALNMDEFAYGFVTENAHFGATRNPHDKSRIAGGSSGGSAAAVAAGMVPLALGSDTNGSIRVPAGLCGVHGLKPTAGRLPLGGVFPFAESLDHAGIFAGAVGDLALAYDVLSNDEEPIWPRLNDLAIAPLRVGTLAGWFTQGAMPEILESLHRVGEALRAERGIELPGAEAARSAAFCLTAHEGASLHLEDLRRRAGDFDPAVRDRLLAGALLPQSVIERARLYREVFRQEAARLFARHDVLLAPATPCLAPSLGQVTMMIDGQPVSVRKNLGAYTQPLSFIGLPVLAAPVNRPGLLPAGVQIIAPHGREDLVFAAAARLEAMGVTAAHPPVAAS